MLQWWKRCYLRWDTDGSTLRETCSCVIMCLYQDRAAPLLFRSSPKPLSHLSMDATPARAGTASPFSWFGGGFNVTQVPLCGLFLNLS